jgi:MSHA biogenesis protein MshJ
MKGWLSKIETSYNLLNKNYKMLVIAATFLLLLIMWYSFLSNLFAKMDKNKKNMTQIKSEVVVLKKQVTVLKTKKISDKAQQYQKKEAQLKESLIEVNKKIASFQYQLISPKAVFSNLKNMLQADKGLKLTSMRYLPEEVVKDTSDQPVSRTPIELTIQGTFPEIMAYLKRVERESTFIFWDEMNYKVLQYPIAVVKLKIHVVTSEAGQKNVAAK